MSRFLEPKVNTVDIEAAEKIYSADLTVNRTILEQGENVKVEGISIANSSKDPAEVTFKDSVGKLKFRETVDSKTTHSEPLRFHTSGGLIAEALTGAQAADVFVNVFYFPV